MFVLLFDFDFNNSQLRLHLLLPHHLDELGLFFETGNAVAQLDAEPCHEEPGEDGGSLNQKSVFVSLLLWWVLAAVRGRGFARGHVCCMLVWISLYKSGSFSQSWLLLLVLWCVLLSFFYFFISFGNRMQNSSSCLVLSYFILAGLKSLVLLFKSSVLCLLLLQQGGCWFGRGLETLLDFQVCHSLAILDGFVNPSCSE